MAKDCSQYIKINKIISALQRNDSSVQQEVILCLDTIYKQSFINRLFLPSLLAPYNEIKKTAEESFMQAVYALLEHIKEAGNAKQYRSIEQPLFLLFKLKYHKQLGQLLQIPDVTAQVSFILLQINIYYRDYLIWHYINNFSVRQICVITGKQADVVKSDLWHSRENLRNWLIKIGSFSTNEFISEQQFYIFLDYFTGETTTEDAVPSEKLVIDDSISVQKNFGLELLFRYHIDKTILRKNISNKTNGPHLTAEEYLDHIKQIILSSKQSNSQTES